MSDQTFPSWRYGPGGEARVFDRADDVPEGWEDHPRGLPDFADPLDHDGDGEKGGSTSAIDDLKALRVAYQAKLGKRPFPAWDTAELNRRMEAA